MGFKLVRVDATEPCKIPLPVGTHLIGRGKFLDCNDHRVSRMHGKLKVTDDVVTITSLHQNPCFFRQKGAPTIHVLPQHKCIDLNNGDQFGLVPDGFWYELIYCIENLSGFIVSPLVQLVKPEKVDTKAEPSGSGSSGDRSMTNDIPIAAMVRPSLSQDTDSTVTDGQEMTPSDMEESSSTKRSHPDSQENINKKQKTEPPTSTCNQVRPNGSNTFSNGQPSGSSENNLVTPKNEPHDSSQNSQNEQQLANVKPEPDSPENDKAGPSHDQQDVQKAAPALVDAAGDNAVPVAGPAAPPANDGQPREKCMYGAQCYRVNPVHKAQFSHPGDDDWAARRVCQWGADCRNLRAAHRRDHEHPPRQPRHRDHERRPHANYGIRVVQRHGNIFYINAHSVHFYDDHFQVQNSDGESVDYDYEF